MSAHFEEWRELGHPLRRSDQEYRVAGDFWGDDPYRWRVYASQTEFREYADTTLAWCYTQEEYERECAAAVALLEKYRAEAEAETV